MICKHNMYLAEVNKQRKKEGLPPLSRRQFCKLAASSSLVLGMPLLTSCDSGKLEPGGCTEDGTGECDYVPQVLGKDNRAEIEVRPGVKLDDYSGPFRPELRFTDFSKKGLSNLIQMASHYHNAIASGYSQYIRDAYGHDAVVNAEKKIWSKVTILPIHMMYKRRLKIKGKDLESFMKFWQLDFNTIPSDISDVYFEMPSERRGLATFNKCPVAHHYETTDQADMLADVCKNRCGNAFQAAAKKFDKDLVVKNLAYPPRESEDHICCKWEVYYKSDGSQSSEETDLLIDPDKMDKRGELVEIPNRNLRNYRGPFRPDLRLSDFSREKLADMYLMFHAYNMTMIAGYSMAEGGAASGKPEENMQVVVWSDELAEAARSVQMKYLKTSGNGIDSFLKALQTDITAQPPDFENDFEMPDENTGIYTFHKCAGLTMLEPVSTPEQMAEMCSLDPPAIGNSCGMYSRGLEGKHIEMEIVQMPPRKYKDAAPCQWRFYYVDDNGNPL